MQLTEISIQKYKDFSNQTSQSSLNLLSKENENDLRDTINKHNIMFFKLIYILSNQTIPEQISYGHLYESVIKTNQVQSISIYYILFHRTTFFKCFS